MLGQKSGEGGRVLYVGKARNLKARVTSYTQPERLTARIRKMVFETCELIVVQTATEAEALLLEANLIKSLKPKYNITLRDDSSHLSVVITGDETPLIRPHRGTRKTNREAEYFGPYPSASAVYQTLNLMERAFRLRTCNDATFRHRSRPCLKYDIKLCSAPCVGKISAENYAASVQQAKRFLRGERTEILTELQSHMAAFSAQQNYEQAARVRDTIKALSATQSAATAVTHSMANADVLAIVAENGQLAVQMFHYRNGQHVGNQAYFPKLDADDTQELPETLRLFLALHYTQRKPPPHIYCNVAPTDAALLAEALTTSAGHKVEITAPQRGEKREIIQQATTNAQSALRRKQAQNQSWQTQLENFGQLLNLPQTPTSLECYDISNISGRFPVASQVVATAEGMQRSRYRRYKITSKTTPDDYAMMAEVLTRRLKRGQKNENCENTLPSIIMVDGGKGQLNILLQVVQNLGLWGKPECPALVAIAKGEDRDKGLETLWHVNSDDVLNERSEFRTSPTRRSPERSEGEGGPFPQKNNAGAKAGSKVEGGPITYHPLPIPHNSPLIFMLQQVRDEAHRFAITFHRSTRTKALSTSRLDEIPGVGPTKKKALLLHFGSLEAIRGASLQALQQAPNIGPTLAQTIYDYFQSS